MTRDSHRLRADQIYQVALPALVRSVDDDDDADDWRLITAAARTELRPNKTGVGGKFLPQMTTVTYADGSQRFFNPDDQMEVRAP